MTQSVLSHGLPPVIGENCRVLVLGSLPGIRSIEMQQYYGHNRNAFWAIIQNLLGLDATTNYEARCDALLIAGIGLWDVLAASVRPGSLDSAIDMSTARPNDFGPLLCASSDISAVAFNGRKAADLFARYCSDLADGTRSYDILTLPSTSPAHAAMSLEEKTRHWSVLKRYMTTN